MEFVRKCGKCGLDLKDPTASTCPVCGTKVIALPRVNIWIGALVQVAFTTIFMLVFGFPKPMIGVFAVLIVIGTAVSAWVKKNPAAARRPPQRRVTQPLLFRVVSFGIALCTLALVAILLFGFVIFMNSWESWHRYEGASYHQTDFEVTRAYYQVHSRGSNEAFASGTVEGQREWMNLLPYLHTMPHSQAEVDAQVPRGTTIHVYFFPGLKGRSRVQVFTGVPPSEANHRAAMNALNYGLLGLAITAGLIFVLSRLRRACLVEDETMLQDAMATATPTQ